MSTRIALDEMAKMMPNSIGHYFTDDAIAAPAARPGLIARIASALRYVAETPRRRRVMNELYSLSARVFDADFAASRIGANGSNPLVREARRAIRAM